MERGEVEEIAEIAECGKTRTQKCQNEEIVEIEGNLR